MADMQKRARVSMDDLRSASDVLHNAVAAGAEEYEPLERVRDWLEAEIRRRQARARHG